VKALLVYEYRLGTLLDSNSELLSFAESLEAETAVFLVGERTNLPRYGGKVYFADVGTYGEYNPTVHKQLLLAAVESEQPDYIVFQHSSYGWDLAPRVSASLKAAQVSEVSAITAEGFEVGCCGGKMRRTVTSLTATTVVTVQAGAFCAHDSDQETPQVTTLQIATAAGDIEFVAYEPVAARDIDLTKAEIIVSAGRGIGKQDNVSAIAALATALNGVLAASRPVVDAGWVEASRQVGMSGQTVTPKLYVACGISGAIQHLAGMKKSGFVVAINKDRNAPISEIADVLIVADVMQFVPALTARLQALRGASSDDSGTN
jgi:electron transfer flavoprotein alpha subunit